MQCFLSRWVTAITITNVTLAQLYSRALLEIKSELWFEVVKMVAIYVHCEVICLLRCDVMYFGRFLPTYRREEACLYSSALKRDDVPNRWHISPRIHDIAPQSTLASILTAARTSNLTFVLWYSGLWHSIIWWVDISVCLQVLPEN
jgi:hypothetical protein